MRLEAPAPAAVVEAVEAPFLEKASVMLDAPVAQPLGLLLDLAGETLRERLFIVQGDGPEACLRTDFTLPALRAHLESGRSEGRYRYNGHAFRVAPRGQTRAEEFLQIGVEAFEPGDPVEADIEMAALAWRSAKAGGRRDLTLVMGDVGLFEAFIESLEIAPALAARLTSAFGNPRRLRAELDGAMVGSAPEGGSGRLAALLAGIPEGEASAVLEDIWALAGIEPVGGRPPAEIVHRLAERGALTSGPRMSEGQAESVQQFLAIAGPPAQALTALDGLAANPAPRLAVAREAWEKRIEGLIREGVPAARLWFAAGFGRAFSYYDGMMFEVRSEALGEDQPIAAGGRYDHLAGKLGASLATGAVGCMARPGRAWAGAKP